MIHDEENRCKIGDRVRIVECRPLSRTNAGGGFDFRSQAEPESPAETAGSRPEPGKPLT
jgi:hypothetical protein